MSFDEIERRLQQLSGLLDHQKEKIKVLTKTCEMQVRSGTRKGQICNLPTKYGSDKCHGHQPVKVKACGAYYRIYGTNVIIDTQTGIILGYHDREKNQVIFESNPIVEETCRVFDLEFRTQEVLWV